MVSTGAGSVVDGDGLDVDGAVARLEGAGMVSSEGSDVVVDEGDDIGMPSSFCDGVLDGAKLARGPTSPPVEARVVADVVVVGVATAGAGPTVVVVVALATTRARPTAGVVAAAASPTVSCWLGGV